MSKGIMLAGIARRRQFKTSHPLVTVCYIIVNITIWSSGDKALAAF